MSRLEAKFQAALIDTYHQTKAETGYNALGFLQLLHNRKGLGAAQYLIHQPRPSEGYVKLFEYKRLDLTVEAIIYDNPEWHPLFTEEEMAVVKRRLQEYEYIPRD